MTKLNLKIDPDRITIDDLIAIEEGTTRSRGARDLIARFVIDDEGNFMEEDEARKIVGKLSIAQLKPVSEQLLVKIRAFMDGSTIPPTNAVS